MDNLNELLYMSRMGDLYAQTTLFSVVKETSIIITRMQISHHPKLSTYYEDIVQEAWITSARAIDSYREDRGASIRTFLSLVITRRITQEMVRILDSDSMFQVSTVEYNDSIYFRPLYSTLGDYDRNMSNPVYYTNYQIAKEKLERKMNTLCVEERAVLSCWIEGYSYKEAAEKLNMDSKTFGRRKENLKKKLKGALFEKKMKEKSNK